MGEEVKTTIYCNGKVVGVSNAPLSIVEQEQEQEPSSFYSNVPMEISFTFKATPSIVRKLFKKPHLPRKEKKMLEKELNSKFPYIYSMLKKKYGGTALCLRYKEYKVKSNE